jgi:hypothetical protein
MAGHTRILGHNYHFARDAEEGNIVPHNPSLLASFRVHHCLEVIHSEQCIGYVLKYCAKNSDAGRISLQNVLYEGYSLTWVNQLHYYAATRISSASECFAAICGYLRHHIKLIVHVLGIHLPGQKIVLTSGPGGALENNDFPSPLERYFSRPIDSSYDQLIYINHHSRYSVDARPASCDADKDVCEHVRFPNPRKNSANLYPMFSLPTDAWIFCPKTVSSTVSCQKLGGPPISQWWSASDFPWGCSPT